MKPASRFFYLAIFALFDPSCAHGDQTTKSVSSPPDVCAVEPNAIVSDACASFSTIDALNADLSKDVRSVTQSTDFFSYYRLNLFNQQCSFWDDGSGMCGNRACAVDTLDNEEDIPVIWRTEELSQIQGPKAKHPTRKEQKEKARPLEGNLTNDVSESCVVEYDDECDERDYCVPEDESAAAKGDYVSLVDNPEKFTGYSGDSAHMVWDAIYKENCFSTQPLASPPQSIPKAGPPSGRSGLMQAASNDLRSVLQANSDPSDFPEDETCLEKRVFYRVISGMHASISTHLCYDYLDQKTGTWGPNLTCFKDRLAKHPDRISNLYFNYGLLLRAMAKLEPYLKSYTFCSGDPAQDLDTKRKVLTVAERAAAAPSIFDESLMFQDPTSSADLKEDFRNRFRNVSRLMDCVGCDKCRLWGKLQTAGYGTALKVLFEFDDNRDADFVLKRTELVALVNTLDRVGASMTSLGHFHQMRHGTVHNTQPLFPTNSRAHPPSSPSVAEGGSISPKNAAANAKENSDDEFDEFEPLPHSSAEEDPPMAEAILDELDLLFRTALYVLREWAGLPRKMGGFLVFELVRLWNFWLGLRSPNIVYEWARPPTREEL